MDNCEWHCEGGWLPTCGEKDALLVTKEMAIDAGDRSLEGQVYTPLLIPTQWRPCFHLEVGLLPEGVVVDD